jgi:hypothetical protein
LSPQHARYDRWREQSFKHGRITKEDCSERSDAPSFFLCSFVDSYCLESCSERLLFGIACLECFALLGSSESLIALVGRSSGLCCFLQTALGSFSYAFVPRIGSDQL